MNLDELRQLHGRIEHDELTIGPDPRTIFTIQATEDGPDFGAEIARTKCEHLTELFAMSPYLLTDLIWEKKCNDILDAALKAESIRHLDLLEDHLGLKAKLEKYIAGLVGKVSESKDHDTIAADLTRILEDKR